MIDRSLVVNNLRQNGWSFVGCLNKNIIADFRDYLDKCSWYNYHVKGKETNVISDRRTAPSNCSCVSMHDVILAPNWFETSVYLTDMVIDYFRTEDIVLYSYNAFYSNPEGKPYDGVQNWHRDYDSDNFLAAFVYMTDVLTIEDGPHAFEQRDGNRVDIYGEAGTVFFADTRQMHMGHKPINKPRGMAWARWSIGSEVKSYTEDRLSPLDKSLIGDRYPVNATLQRVIRKVVC